MCEQRLNSLMGMMDSMMVSRVGSAAISAVSLYRHGPMAVWLGMFSDWFVRAIIFTIRYRSGRWLAHKLV